jgi:hypothetical protein
MVNHDPFGAHQRLKIDSIGSVSYYSLPRLETAGVANISRLPHTIKILLESLLRNCNGDVITEEHIVSVANWQPQGTRYEIPFKPGPNHLNQTVLTGIITRTGIAPMFRLVHVAPLYGIVMNVIQLLTHNHLRFDDLRMIAFFPNLISGLLLMGAFKKRQQLQQLDRAALFQMRDDLFCRVGFKALHVMAQIIRRGDKMQMIFKDDVTI